jgi:hypothetical protein
MTGHCKIGSQLTQKLLRSPQLAVLRHSQAQPRNELDWPPLLQLSAQLCLACQMHACHRSRRLQQENSTNSSQELADALCQTSTSLRAILTHKSVDACHLPNENLSGSSSPRDSESLCEAQSASTAQNQSSCQQSVKGNAAAHFAEGMLADTVDNVEVQFPADARMPNMLCMPATVHVPS